MIEMFHPDMTRICEVPVIEKVSLTSSGMEDWRPSRMPTASDACGSGSSRSSTPCARSRSPSSAAQTGLAWSAASRRTAVGSISEKMRLRARYWR